MSPTAIKDPESKEEEVKKTEKRKKGDSVKKEEPSAKVAKAEPPPNVYQVKVPRKYLKSTLKPLK